jgi:hypothetical protein
MRYCDIAIFQARSSGALQEPVSCRAPTSTSCLAPAYPSLVPAALPSLRALGTLPFSGAPLSRPSGVPRPRARPPGLHVRRLPGASAAPALRRGRGGPRGARRSETEAASTADVNREAVSRTAVSRRRNRSNKHGRREPRSREPNSVSRRAVSRRRNRSNKHGRREWTRAWRLGGGVAGCKPRGSFVEGGLASPRPQVAASKAWKPCPACREVRRACRAVGAA